MEPDDKAALALRQQIQVLRKDQIVKRKEKWEETHKLDEKKDGKDKGGRRPYCGIEE